MTKCAAASDCSVHAFSDCEMELGPPGENILERVADTMNFGMGILSLLFDPSIGQISMSYILFVRIIPPQAGEIFESAKACAAQRSHSCRFINSDGTGRSYGSCKS